LITAQWKWDAIHQDSHYWKHYLTKKLNVTSLKHIQSIERKYPRIA